MKISVFPKCWLEDISEGRMDLFEWIDISTQLECEGLELYPEFLKERAPQYITRVRKYIEDRGMVVSMMCHSPDFTVPEEELQGQIDAQCEMIRITAALGSTFCRTLSGQRRPGLNEDNAVAQVVRCIEACLPEAEKNGVMLTMENHFKDGYWLYPEFAQKSNVFFRIIDQIDSPWFGVQYDPSNALLAGEDPVILLDRILPRVRSMHASDRYLETNYQLDDVMLSMAQNGYPKHLHHGEVGKGLIDYPAIFQRLGALGYDGWVSIEDGINGMQEMKNSVDYLKKMRKQYF